jgi:hypothetical protein
MNTKLKAALITIAGFFGIIAFFYTIINYPLVIVFAGLSGFMYFIYRGVLRHLERKERLKK